MLCRKETITYQAKPKIYDINKYSLSLKNSIFNYDDYLQFILKGNFLEIRNLYLSASNEAIFDLPITFFNPFSSIKNLSAENIGFSAIMLNIYTYNEVYLAFDFPKIPLDVGYVDVIVENEAGYSLLSKETYVKEILYCDPTPNFQKPCVSGIQITQ
jgi:hypothetical protein